MSVRAYKIAQELGIERNEFVERARELGIELKSAMAALDEEQVALLRAKLGAKKEAVTEARVETKAGSGAVIRRRKRVVKKEAPAPAPPPEEAPRHEATPELEPAVSEPLLEGEAEEEERPAAETPAPAPAEPAAEPEFEVPPPPAPTPAPQPAPSAAPAPRPAADAGADRKGRQRKQFKEVVNLREQEQLARQVTSRAPGRHHPVQVDPRAFSSPRRRRRDAPQKKKEAAPAAPKAQRRLVRVDNEISVAELAKQLGAKAAEIQAKLMSLGTMVAVNQAVDLSTAEQVAAEFGFEVQNVGFQESEFLEEAPTAAEESDALRARPPVVTVMGHVDHGKTSLLDAIRQANVVAGEAGGITQHIGAYQAKAGDQTLTFIDTPGHAAFTAMRARGAQVTDIVILVVAASEGIMPQTIEAIDHAKAAGVPIVVAVNKCDLPDANPQRVRQRLMEHGLVTEEFGGEILAVDVSATKKQGLDKLLEAVALQAELLELRADPTRRAQGVVLEASLDKGRGPVATVLIQSGTLSRGDIVVVGTCHGRVRSMLNDHGQTLKEAGPSMPVQLIGLSGVPAAGEVLNAVESDRVAKQIVDHRESEQRQRPQVQKPRVSLEQLFAQAEGAGPKELNVVIKADTDGSCEALRESLLQIQSDKVNLSVIHAAVGAIGESDVQLAHASEAIVVGFHVRPDPGGRKAAETLGVDVRTYQVIYEVIDEIRAAMAGLLAPTTSEAFLGRAEVRETFTIPRVGTVAGCYVTEGLVRRGARARLLRDGTQVFDGAFASLRRFKDDVREVQTGFECGIGLEGFNDVKIGDVIEAYEIQEQAAEL